METEIKRVNFFNGQFLKEGEFLAEQLYHLHMRRRLNYMLFETPGVIADLELTHDDLQFEVINHVARTFRVKRGTAIALVEDAREGKEIILRDPSAISSLDDFGIGAAATGFVAIRQVETKKKDPPSEGGVDGDTRVEEGYEITVEDAWPPVPGLPDPDEYVLLGTLTFNGATNQLESDYSSRHEAKLRSALLGGGGGAPGMPAIVNMTPISAPAGAANLLIQIGGTNLGGASVSFSHVSVSLVSVVTSTPTTFAFTINVQSGAFPGGCVVTLTTAVGSATTNLQILGLPAIAPWTDTERRKNGTETLDIHGDQFAAPMSVAFKAATVGDPDVVVPATVLTINEATVVVPGPFIPNPPTAPALVRSGQITVTTAAGTSAQSPTAFILEIT